LKNDNLSAPDTETELQGLLRKEEEEKMERVAHQKELEGKLEELTDKLEEQQEIRSEWERKRKRIEEETKKLQKLHSVQMQKIKKTFV